MEFEGIVVPEPDTILSVLTLSALIFSFQQWRQQKITLNTKDRALMEINPVGERIGTLQPGQVRSQPLIESV
jgi:hypothetical protein